MIISNKTKNKLLFTFYINVLILHQFFIICIFNINIFFKYLEKLCMFLIKNIFIITFLLLYTYTTYLYNL